MVFQVYRKESDKVFTSNLQSSYKNSSVTVVYTVILYYF